MDLIENFRVAMEHEGIVINEKIIPDGDLHRFHVNGDKGCSRNGWYVLYLNGLASGAFGC